MGIESPKINQEQPQQEQRKRPGGPIQGKPIQDFEGKWHNQSGEEISTDAAYAQAYWNEQKIKGMPEKNIDQMRQSMRDTIEQQEEGGIVGIFVDKTGITDEFKRKLSAYREIAREMGYEIGEFRFNENSGNVTASIKKREAK